MPNLSLIVPVFNEEEVALLAAHLVEGLAEALALALEGQLEPSAVKGREVLALAEKTGLGVLSATLHKFPSAKSFQRVSRSSH